MHALAFPLTLMGALAALAAAQDQQLLADITALTVGSAGLNYTPTNPAPTGPAGLWRCLDDANDNFAIENTIGVTHITAPPGVYYCAATQSRAGHLTSATVASGPALQPRITGFARRQQDQGSGAAPDAGSGTGGDSGSGSDSGSGPGSGSGSGAGADSGASDGNSASGSGSDSATGTGANATPTGQGVLPDLPPLTVGSDGLDFQAESPAPNGPPGSWSCQDEAGDSFVIENTSEVTHITAPAGVYKCAASQGAAATTGGAAPANTGGAGGAAGAAAGDGNAGNGNAGNGNAGNKFRPRATGRPRI